jgi:hypothetical protein
MLNLKLPRHSQDMMFLAGLVDRVAFKSVLVNKIKPKIQTS